MTDKPSLKLWRTLIGVRGHDEYQVFIQVPAWSTKQTIRLRFRDLPNNIESAILNGKEYFHAKVNIGADESSDLKFENWEIG